MSVLDPEYAFSSTFLPPLKMSEELPSGEGPSTRYIADRAALQTRIILNNITVKARSLLDPFDTLEDYDDIFQILSLPNCSRTWQTDLLFAEQRLSGMHPNFIETVSSVPSFFDEQKVKAALTSLFGTQTPQLFWCNWSRYLRNLPNGTWEGGLKRLKPSAALFGWRNTQHADRGELVPIAIVVDVADKSTTTTALDGRYAWLAARIYAQVADLNVHELSSHLYGAHFFQEPIALATGRYLRGDHPVRRLLTPHLRFLLFNNDLGKQVLVNPGGSVDQLLAGTLAGSLEIVKTAHAEHDFTKHAFPNDLAARGLADPAVLPHYPYRDDGQLHWDAIGSFVQGYIDVFYNSDAAVAADAQLGFWWDCLAGPPQSAADAVPESGLRGVPKQRTKTDLAFILQRVIFTAGPYHSAVNYPQYEYLAFSPNQPAAAYGELSSGIDSEEDLLAILPPFKQAMKQLEVAEQLAGYRYDRLAEYRDDELPDEPAVQALAQTFRSQLDDAERTIDDRNRRRRLPYRYLKPSLVTNSTSV